MKKLLPLLLLAAWLPRAQAVEYRQIQPAASRVDFAYTQMGVPMEGRFRKFSGELQFDPAKPAKARASLDIELASVDTGVGEADQELAGKGWFNTAAHPVARFVSTGVRHLGDNRYEVSGNLTIKGKTQPVVAPATFTPQGKNAVFEGALAIRRGDFAIGEGSWSKFDIVANDIRIRFRITASGQ